MGEVRVFTAARSKRIEDTTIVSGEVNEVGELNLITRAGEVVYAGNIKGPQGIPGNGFNSFLITAAMDFNDIKSPGLYHITSSAVAVASPNTPTYTGFAANKPGYLLVEGNGSTYVKQTWTNFNNPAETLVRTLYSTWYAWAPPIELSSETQVGIARMATSAETQTGTSKVLAVTPFGLAARTATETRTGLVELATTVEASAGTDTTRAITAAGLKSAVVFKWIPGFAYVIGDRVLSPTDELVTCLTAHTASATFPTDILKWSYSSAPRGLVAYSQNVANTGQMTTSTILLTIASYTFRANRTYRVIANLGYYANGVSTTASFTLNRAATSDAASSTSGLTPFAQVTNRPNVTAEGRFDLISRDNLTFTTDRTQQIKLMLQPLNATNYYVALASSNTPMTLCIYDEGILS